MDNRNSRGQTHVPVSGNQIGNNETQNAQGPAESVGQVRTRNHNSNPAGGGQAVLDPMVLVAIQAVVAAAFQAQEHNKAISADENQ